MTPPEPLAAIESALAGHGLCIAGVAPVEPADGLPADRASLLLVGPAPGEGMWRAFTASPEGRDGHADPLDRWSRRVIGDVARRFDALPLFPFDGPPHLPFPAWARRSGRAWTSPVHLLVHDTAGLLASWRGALALHDVLPLHRPERPRPCEDCAGRPCATACPAGVLTPKGYDVAACRAFVASSAGRLCREQGCRVRLACPLSQTLGRPQEQSAFHMRAFLP